MPYGHDMRQVCFQSTILIMDFIGEVLQVPTSTTSAAVGAEKTSTFLLKVSVCLCLCSALSVTASPLTAAMKIATLCLRRLAESCKGVHSSPISPAFRCSRPCNSYRYYLYLVACNMAIQ